MIDYNAVLDCCGKCMVFEVDEIQKDFYRSSDIQISEGRFTLDDLNAWKNLRTIRAFDAHIFFTWKTMILEDGCRLLDTFLAVARYLNHQDVPLTLVKIWWFEWSHEDEILPLFLVSTRFGLMKQATFWESKEVIADNIETYLRSLGRMMGTRRWLLFVQQSWVSMKRAWYVPLGGMFDWSWATS